MLILAIETTGPFASVALTDGEKMTEIMNKTNYSHLQEIAPMVMEILAREKVDPKDLDALAVSMGPGSFTGLRIGMVSAKGFAQIWNKPLITVPTLAEFAYADDPMAKGCLVCPIFDARRSQVYGGIYKDGEALIPDGAYSINEYLEKLNAVQGKQTAIFYGDGVDAYLSDLQNYSRPVLFADEEFRTQRASCTARLAVKMFKEGKIQDAFTAEPEYLRAAEAERKLKDGSLKPQPTANTVE